MNKKVLIIGAGISGLACGIYAQKNGIDSIIVEKTHFAGGNLTGWKRKDCYIDNCIHWLNGSKDGNNLNKIWKEVGAFENIDFHQSEDFIVSELNGETISLNKDIDVTCKNMLKLSPQDKKEINKFIKATKLITNFQNKNSFGKLVSLLKIFSIYKTKTIKQVASKFKNQLLRKFLTDYILEEYSIYSLLCAYSSFYSGDGKVIKQGSLKMAQNIEKRYKELGGEIRFNSAVESIIIENNIAIGVRLKNGEAIYADTIVCCNDPTIVFNKFLKNIEMPLSLQDAYSKRKTYPIISSFHIAYKAKESIDIPDTFVFELKKPIKIGATDYSRLMLRNYAYGENFTKDDSYVMQVFLLQRERDYDKWASFSQEDYVKEKKRVVDEITNEIFLRFPSLQGNLEYLDCWTPLTYTRYFGAYKGSYMSFGITKRIKAKFYPYKCEQIQNLYFASQWQKIFGGLPNALLNGKACAEEICLNLKQQSSNQIVKELNKTNNVFKNKIKKPQSN